MPTCKSCGTSGSADGWGRYSRNGRLKVLCPNCDRAVQAAHERNKAAQEAGYRCWANTPEYRRRQREAQARKLSREIAPYVPQSERNHRSRLRQAERLADRIRAQWAAKWLQPFREDDYRQRDNAHSRKRYWLRRDQEVERTLAFKRAHPDRVATYHVRRKERLVAGSDGTATDRELARLKRSATHCAYCGERLIRKQTDHMIPLALGGEHSLRNIVIVCPDCNARKATLSYPEWIDRVAPQHRPRVIALYRERYRAAAA